MNETETAPEPTTEELVAQWEELRRQLPPPTWEEVIPEWKWIRGLMADPTAEFSDRYGGQWVVVYQQHIIAQGFSPLQLQVAKARELGIHPERFVVTYVCGEWPGPSW